MQFLSNRRLARIDRAVISGRIIPYLAFATLVITVIAGVSVRILAPRDFDSLGDALWWAAQTVTTVGYGDVVPDSGPGRLVAVLVMFVGVAAVSLITAVVTSAFVAWQQRQLTEVTAHEKRTHDALDRIEQRLEALEQRLFSG